MKSYKNAVAEAHRRRHLMGNHGEPLYVVFSKDEYDNPGDDYHIATDNDIDTFFEGCKVLYCTD